MSMRLLHRLGMSSIKNSPISLDIICDTLREPYKYYLRFFPYQQNPQKKIGEKNYQRGVGFPPISAKNKELLVQKHYC